MSAERGDGDETSRQNPLLRKALSLLSDVHRGEGTTVLILLLTIFLLLIAYYVLKTVREPLVLASAAQDIRLVRDTSWPSWLKDVLLNDAHGPQLKAVASGFQALLLLGYVPAYSWLASKISRIRLIVVTTIFFVLCLQTFFLLRLAGVPMLGFVYYIWLGIFSISAVAQFWSFGNDLYTEEQGKRLFPIVGVGAVAGAPVGAKVAKWLYGYLAPRGAASGLDPFQRWVAGLGIDPSFVLLQLPAFLLLVFMALMAWVSRRESHRARRDADGGSDERPAADGSVWSLILKSPYVRLIAAVVLLLNVVNTMGEFLLSDAVVETSKRLGHTSEQSESVWIGRFYGDFYFYVNILALLLQAFVVSRLAKLFGLKGVLLVLPLVSLGTYSLFAAGVGIYALRWAKTAENGTDYSIMNTGKAMVWLPTSRAAKYRAKQAVDTLLVRVGDVVSALIFLVGTVVLSVGRRPLALVNIGFVVLYLSITFVLLRQHRRIVEAPEEDPAALGTSEAAAPSDRPGGTA